MRFLRLECKKVFGDKRFWMMLVFLVFLQCFLLYRGETKGHFYSISSYRDLYGQLAQMRPEEAAAYAKGRKEMLQYEQSLLYGEEMKRPSWNTSWPDRLYTGEISRDYLLFDAVSKEVGAVLGRDAQIAETIESAGRLGSIRLFQAGEDSYTQKNREKTAADFSLARSIPVTKVSPEQGIRLVMENGVGDAFVLALIFFAVYLMVFQGYENGLEAMIAASKNGRGRLLFSRGLAVFLSAGAVWGLIFGSGLLCGGTWYSLGDLTRPVQYLSDYVLCLPDLSAGGLLLLTFFGKWLIFGALGLLLLFFVRLTRNMAAPSFLIFALFWLGYFLWRGIPDSSLYRPLRYLNLYYLLRPDMAFATYRNLDILTTPVACRLIWTAVVLGIAAGSVLILVLTRRMHPKAAKRKAAFLARKRRRKERTGPHIWNRSFLTAEFYKVWWMRRLCLLFLLAAAFQIWNYSGKEIFQGFEERIYANYITAWQREIDGRDEELKEIIREEEKRVREELVNASGSQAAELRYVAFIQAQGRFMQLQYTAGGRGIHPWLIYEGVYDFLVNDPEQDVAAGCLAFVLLLISVVLMTGYEYRSGMRAMLKTMKRGWSRYLPNKILVLVSVCLVILLVVWLPDIWLTWRTWAPDTLDVPVYSLPVFANFPLTISVRGYLCFLYAGRFLVLWLTGIGMLLAMDVLKNEMAGLLTLGVVLGLPFLLYYINGSGSGRWGLLTWLGWNGLWKG